MNVRNTDASEWHCEECGQRQNGTPAVIQRFEGPDGEVTLYFCSECARYEL